MACRWLPALVPVVGVLLAAGHPGHHSPPPPPKPVMPVAVPLYVGVDTAMVCAGQLQVGYRVEILTGHEFAFAPPPAGGPGVLEVFDVSGRWQSPNVEGPHGKWLAVADYQAGQVRNLDRKFWWTGVEEARGKGAHFYTARVRLTSGAGPGLASAPKLIDESCGGQSAVPQ